jgi:hypothetical protein
MGWGAPIGNIKGPAGDPEGAVNGLTPLLAGQDYVDVDFGFDQDNLEWIVRALNVINTTDASPARLVPMTMVQKTVSGFRVLLNGAPDTGNYLLAWGVLGTPPPPPTEATTYLMSGPTGGIQGQQSTPFLLSLPPNTFLSADVSITPAETIGNPPSTDFTPPQVTLGPNAASATFIYTPATAGDKSISCSNSGGLTDPTPLPYHVQGMVLDASYNQVGTISDTWYGGDDSAVGEFFTSNGGVLDHVKKVIRVTGAPTGNVFAKIYTSDNVNYIPGSLLATSDPVAISAIAAGDWNTFNFSGSNRITLDNGGNYFVVFEFTGGDASNKLGYLYSGDSGYGGWCVTNHLGAWTNLSFAYDTDFEVWVIR